MVEEKHSILLRSLVKCMSTIFSCTFWASRQLPHTPALLSVYFPTRLCPLFSYLLSHLPSHLLALLPTFLRKMKELEDRTATNSTSNPAAYLCLISVTGHGLSALSEADLPLLPPLHHHYFLLCLNHSHPSMLLSHLTKKPLLTSHFPLCFQEKKHTFTDHVQDIVFSHNS